MIAACVAAFTLGAAPASPPGIGGAAARSSASAHHATNAKEWEVTSQVSVGGGVRYDSRMPGAQGLFSSGLRMDMLFGRRPPHGWAAGWFVSGRVDNFSNVALTGGASFLLPAHDTFPFVLSVGTAGRYDRDGLAFGAVERLWWGARSPNYDGHYVLSGGLFIESRQFFDPYHTVDVIVGLDIDLELTAIPFMALYTWIFRTDPKAR